MHSKKNKIHTTKVFLNQWHGRKGKIHLVWMRNLTNWEENLNRPGDYCDLCKHDPYKPWNKTKQILRPSFYGGLNNDVLNNRAKDNPEKETLKALKGIEPVRPAITVYIIHAFEHSKDWVESFLVKHSLFALCIAHYSQFEHSGDSTMQSHDD